ncbi:MAG: EpsG family protein [Sphingobacterium sp.]
MDSYLYLVLIVCILVPFSSISKKWLFITFLILGLFSGIRFNVGIDFENYLDIYKYALQDLNITSEPFFIYVIKFCDLLGGSSQMLFLVMALLTNYFMYRYVTEQSLDPTLSMLIYFSVISFYLFSFNISRQWAACSIYLFSLIYLINKRYIVFLSINIITALVFHKSLLYVSALTLITVLDLNRKMKLLGILMAIIVGVFIKVILGFTGYEKYTESSFDMTVDFKIYIFFLINLIIDVFKSKLENKEHRGNLSSKILFNLNFISLLILIIIIIQQSGAMVLLFKRIHNYFLATYIVLIPYCLLSVFPSDTYKFVRFALIIILPLLFISTVYFAGKGINILPFDFNLKFFK